VLFQQRAQPVKLLRIIGAWLITVESADGDLAQPFVQLLIEIAFIPSVEYGPWILIASEM
jgi:hypothetical protein